VAGVQKLITGFPDPPLEEVDHRILKACRDSVLTCLRIIHDISEADNSGVIQLSVTDRFIIRVSTFFIIHTYLSQTE